jgi:hypothetical protein
MHCFKYTSAASVFAVLLLSSACSTDESTKHGAQKAQDAGAMDASSATNTLGGAGSRSKSGRADGGIAADKSDTDAGANEPETQVKSTGGSGGAGASNTARTTSGQGGSGGTKARTTGNSAGSAGQPTAGTSARGGAGGSTPSGSDASGGSGGTGGANIDAGSDQSEGSAGEGGASEQGSAGDGGDEAGGAGGTGGAGGSDEGSAGAAGGSDEAGQECAQISRACSAVASPSSDAMACAMVGESGDASTCQARLGDCRQACGAPLCQQLTAECPNDSADTARNGCRQLGVTNDPNNCFGDGPSCLDLCHSTMP